MGHETLGFRFDKYKNKLHTKNMSAHFEYAQCKPQSCQTDCGKQKGNIQIPIIAGVIILLVIGIYIFSQNKPQLPPETSSKPLTEGNTGSSKITTEQARMVVQNLPEVQDYLKEVPNGKVEVDNEGEGEYNVHVYEVKNGHTATFNWYRVSIKSGEVSPQFETKGKVSGKLCYPSEVVPEGTIEAKRISDGKVFILNHGGSEDEAGPKFTFKLEEGDYYLRYKTSGGLFGYSTTVCPTGKEETCGNTKPRVLRKAGVKIGETISGYDLCDYYYKDSNAPKF